jgi:hypothetical protein
VLLKWRDFHAIRPIANWHIGTACRSTYNMNPTVFITCKENRQKLDDNNHYHESKGGSPDMNWSAKSSALISFNNAGPHQYMHGKDLRGLFYSISENLSLCNIDTLDAMVPAQGGTLCGIGLAVHRMIFTQTQKIVHKPSSF